MKKYFSSKPINKWGQQIKQRIMGIINSVPLILNSKPNHLSKAGIARVAGFREYSSAVDGLVKFLRPNDYCNYFDHSGNRNPARRLGVRQKIAFKRRNKVKIDDIRCAIGKYIISEKKKNWNKTINLDQVKEDISKNEYLKIFEKVKFSDYINKKIKQTIKVVYLLIKPYYSKKPGLSQMQIKDRTKLDTAAIKKLSKELEKEFSEFYNHKKRFSLEFTECSSGKRRSSSGRLVSDIQIKFSVCNYIFSKLMQKWNQKLNLNKLITDIDLNSNLKTLRGIKITKYLEKQFKKYFIAVPLIMEPYFSQNSNNLKIMTIEEIHQISGLDHRQIRQISKNFEKIFGENIYNDLERFPIPQNELKDSIKGYPKKFYDPKLRREIRLSQTVIIRSDRLIQTENGVFRDLLTGETIKKNENRDLHHINYDKNDNKTVNLCYLKSEIHNKISANQFNQKIADYFKNILINNKLALKNGFIPKTWKDSQKLFLNYDDNNQLDLNKWL
jgi:hypothetical protein